MHTTTRTIRRMMAAVACITIATVNVALATPQLSAQAAATTPAAKFVDSARVEIDSAAAANNDARLARAIVLLDRALTAFPNDPYALHYRGFANYRRVVSLFMSGKMQEAGPFLSAAITDLQRSGDKLHWAETYALLAAMQGFRIALDPDLGRDLGMEIGALTGEAMQIGPNNPRVLLLQAYSAQNTPPEYGGGVDRARELVARALKAFETDKPLPLAPAWGKAEAVILQGTLGAKP